MFISRKKLEKLERKVNFLCNELGYYIEDSGGMFSFPEEKLKFKEKIDEKMNKIDFIAECLGYKQKITMLSFRGRMIEAKLKKWDKLIEFLGIKWEEKTEKKVEKFVKLKKIIK